MAIDGGVRARLHKRARELFVLAACLRHVGDVETAALVESFTKEALLIGDLWNDARKNAAEALRATGDELAELQLLRKFETAASNYIALWESKPDERVLSEESRLVFQARTELRDFRHNARKGTP